MTGSRPCVLLLAGGATWEGPVLRALTDAGIVVTKRCVDVPDLMASATAGGATVAVVAGDLPWLDAEAVTHLLRYDVRTLAVTRDPALVDRLSRIGVVDAADPDPADVVAGVQRVLATEVVADPDVAGRHLAPATGASRGRVVAVWGPTGAPGRTTVAVGVAAQVALGGPVVLVDADPYGGTVAQWLGVLDELSGVLAVARMANLGTLDAAALARACRRVGTHLDVLTGLPRADRRVEVRPGVMGQVVDVAASLGDVVVDCGFCLEDDGPSLGRDQMTLDTLEAADEVLVVGSAEPAGLARLARGLVELRDVVPDARVRVVVNRMRPSLGWSERDVVGMVEGYARPVGVHVLPEDTASLDRAHVSGRALTELGESPLRAAVAELAGATFARADGPLRRRTAGRARRLCSRP